MKKDYLPSKFATVSEDAPFEVAKRFSFANFITTKSDELYASRIPLVLRNKAVLAGHIARANPQAKHLVAGQKALILFDGPHSYISPQWYKDSDEVPTWDYVQVKVRGEIELVKEEELLSDLKDLVIENEQSTHPDDMWSFEEHLKTVKRQLGAILGFRVVNCQWAGKFKLSQNRPEDIHEIINRLCEQDHHSSKELAQYMKSVRESYKS